MKCSAFIATSIDGYIARKNGDISWLQNAGNADADMGENRDMGFKNYLSSVDCIIMGRNTMEKISTFNLTDEEWPYGTIPIITLSTTLKSAPENMKNRVEIYAGDTFVLLEQLEKKGYTHAYIDGGATIQHFINLALIDEMTVTRVPILLGEGLSLFGKTSGDIRITEVTSKSFPNDFIQEKFSLSYI